MNSNKIVCLYVPYHNTGGHFINWSLHYLAGHANYWGRDNQMHPVEDITGMLFSKNLHHHACKILRGYSESFQYCQDVDQKIAQPVSFVYITQCRVSDILRTMFSIGLKDSTVEQRKQAVAQIKTDTAEMLQWIQHNHKLIVIDYSITDLLNIAYNDRCPMNMHTNLPANSMEERMQLYKDTFFAESQSKFDNNIWDVREQLALTMQIPSYNFDCDLFDRYLPHLYYNTDDIWNDFPNVLLEIFKYAELPLRTERMSSWHSFYNQWRQVHAPGFSRHFAKIIESIINGYYMDLSRFNMNLFHEALIQATLLRQHNLNLKTWQLEKFPTNTQDLHKLLEPNIHTL